MTCRVLVACFCVALIFSIAAASALAAPPPADRSVAQGACQPRPVTPIGEGFFTDITIPAGLKTDPPASPLRGHARVAFGDIDGDGFDDIVATNMSGGVRAGTERFEHLVYRNNGDGTFTDVSVASGLFDVQASFFTFGDLDNDGDQDVFAGLDIQDHPEPGHTHVVLLNDGQGHFTVKSDAGIEKGSGEANGVPLYGAGAAVLADFNGDGKLDLYLGNGNTGSTGYTMVDQLFYGQGDGTFSDVSYFRLRNRRDSLSNGAMACDFDNDGDQDVFVSTYGVSQNGGQKMLWINDGYGSFTNEAVARGVSSQPGGNTWRSDMDKGRIPEPNKKPGEYIGANGFGVDCPDINNDGRIDILMATISHPTEFPFPFRDWSRATVDEANYTRKWSDPSQILVNLGESAGWAFRNEWMDRNLPYNEGDIDAASADFDNDGRLDIVMSRDRKYEGDLSNPVYPGIDQQGWVGVYHQGADGKFTSVGYTSGINHPEDTLGAQRMRGSGIVNWSDIDHDGDLDVLIGGGPGSASGHVFRNDIGSRNDWLAVRLVGDGKRVNRDAMGARVTIADGKVTLTREIKSSRGTYNAMDTHVLHFGLGALTCDYRMTIRWPDGKTQVLRGADVGRNTYVTFTYPQVRPVYLPALARVFDIHAR
jgi:enediyne biosynthesis protein E4